MPWEILGDALFGCWHRRKTIPISPRLGPDRRTRPAPFETYVVCLDCGKEFPYSWKEMRPLTPAEIGRATAHVGGEEMTRAARGPVSGPAFAASATNARA